MISCRDLSERLFDWTAGLLPPEQQEPVEQHLRICPPCQAFTATYQLTIQLARRLPAKPLPPILSQRLQALLAAEQEAIKE